MDIVLKSGRSVPLLSQPTSRGGITTITSPRLEDRLNIAVIVAKRSLLSTTQRIGEAIVIADIASASIVVDIIISPHGNRCLVVYNTTTPERYISYNDYCNFRYIYFRKLKDCRIFVKCKLLKLMFDSCDNCQISIKESIVSTLDMFRCTYTNVHIRVKDMDEPIPMTTIESCETIGIFQSSTCLCYLIKNCCDVNGTMVDVETGERGNSYKLGKLFWGEVEQVLVCLSQTEGFAAVPMSYELNKIGVSVTIDSDVVDEQIEPISETPPMPKGMWDSFMG